jgi:protein tyrosine phosphatase
MAASLANAHALAEEFRTLELLCAPQALCTSYNDRVLRHPSAMTFWTAPKNRYGNILPNEETRVKLKAKHGVEGSDYINGNYIFENLYVSCQAPIPSTFGDFWRMVWEQNSGIIVMVTKLLEGGKKKADLYWPDEGCTATYDGIMVTLRNVFHGEHFDTRVFDVSWENERRKIYHFQYLEWPDFGVPQSTHGILKLAKYVKAHHERAITKGMIGPLVVHCSAGVGRSGTFIAIYHIIQRIHAQLPTNVMELVLQMRKHRGGMVQTEDQYLFIHRAYEDYLIHLHKKQQQDNKRPLNALSSVDVSLEPKWKRKMYPRSYKMSFSLNDLDLKQLTSSSYRPALIPCSFSSSTALS